MSSLWPDAVDALLTTHASGDQQSVDHATVHNDLADAVNKLEKYGDIVFNVKGYGAVGDGSTDDTTAVQAAVDAAKLVGGAVYFPPATYVVSSISVPHDAGVTFRGDGATASILQHKSGSDRCIIYHESSAGADSGQDIWIEGLKLVGEGKGIAGGGNNQRGGIWLDNVSNITIKDCVLTDFRDVGINLWPKDRVRVINTRVENSCTTDQGWNAINYANARAANEPNLGPMWIVGCEVTDCDNGGICASAVPTLPTDSLKAFVLFNVVTNCGWAGIALESRYWQQIVISFNQVYNCWSSIEIGSGGGTEFPNLPQQTYHIISDNIIDQQMRSSGLTATACGINVAGARIRVKNNVIRASRTGILVAATGTGSFAEDISIDGNEIVIANNDTTRTELGISVGAGRRVKVGNNTVGRLVARVVGGQTVGAGGQLEVDTLEGWASSGTITWLGAQQSFTAIAQASGSSTNAKLTISTGGTFADGDLIFVGGMGSGIGFANDCRDCEAHDNTVVNPGARGIQSGGRDIDIRDNKVINPASQNPGGDEHGIYLNGSGVDQRVYDNVVYDNTGTPNSITAYGVIAGETRCSFVDNYADGYSTLFAYDINATPVIWRNNRKSSTHVPDGGISTQTPGAVTTVNIAHGLPGTPTVFGVTPGDADSRGAPAFYATADGTNIILTFASALTAATSYTWNWHAKI